MPETASEKEQLWQLGEARVFDQMTSDQASGGLKHEYYHLQDQHHDPFQMTRPTDLVFQNCFYVRLWYQSIFLKITIGRQDIPIGVTKLNSQDWIITQS